MGCETIRQKYFGITRRAARSIDVILENRKCSPVRKREPMNRPPQMAKPILDNLVKASGVFAG
jgi:hypothetical protein